MPTRAEINFIETWTSFTDNSWADWREFRCHLSEPGRDRPIPTGVTYLRNYPDRRVGPDGSPEMYVELTPRGQDLIATAKICGIPEHADDETPRVEIAVGAPKTTCPDCKGRGRVPVGHRAKGSGQRTIADLVDGPDGRERVGGGQTEVVLPGWDVGCEPCGGSGQVAVSERKKSITGRSLTVSTRAQEDFFDRLREELRDGCKDDRSIHWSRVPHVGENVLALGLGASNGIASAAAAEERFRAEISALGGDVGECLKLAARLSLSRPREQARSRVLDMLRDGRSISRALLRVPRTRLGASPWVRAAAHDLRCADAKPRPNGFEPGDPPQPAWETSVAGMRKILAESVGRVIGIRAKFQSPDVQTLSAPLCEYGEYPMIEVASMGKIHMGVGSQHAFAILAVRVPEREPASPIARVPS